MPRPRALLRPIAIALFGSAALGPWAPCAAAGEPSAAPQAQTPNQGPAPAPGIASYDIGLMLGNQLERNGIVSTLSIDDLMRGLRDGIGGKTPTPEERDTAARFMRTAREALIEHNRSTAREFLEKNSKQPGIVTLPSGLQYRVLAAGDVNAKSPQPSDLVTVRYRTLLADGTEIDRSETHGHPATFRVDSVFKGWQEAFLAMKPGASWQLFVPPELGYGNSPPQGIPPGAALVYELELLSVDSRPRMAEPAPGPHPAAHDRKATPKPAPTPKP